MEAIEQFYFNDIEIKEFTFNVYSVVLFLRKNEVIISDDISPEGEPAARLSLDDFYRRVKDFEVKR